MTRAALIVSLPFALACCSDAKTGAVAELVAATGDVKASTRAQPDDWRPSAPGAVYLSGDGVRTGDDASARVRVLRGDGVLRMGPRALVRFGAHADNTAPVTLESGDATLEAGKVELSLGTAVGVARVAPGTVLQARTEDGATRVEVLVGRAVLESGEAAGLKLGVGEPVEVTADGLAKLGSSGEPADAGPVEGAPGSFDAGSDAGLDAGAAADAARDAAPDAGGAESSEANAQEAGSDVRLRGRKVSVQSPPDRVIGAMVAGGTSTIHAPSVPARLRLELGEACPQKGASAVVELRKGRRRRFFAGKKSVSVAAGPGRHRYRVFCNQGGTLQPTSTGGALVVRRDSGRRKVKTSAPQNEIEADGRKYRLLYQNRKPTVVLTWPRAPEAREYELVVASAGGKVRTFRSDKPRRKLSSGALADGTYTWHFRTANGTAKSPTSRLVIDFDNAAPAAQINRVAWVDNKLEVSGVATQGSTITVSGESVQVDKHFRFKVRASVGPRESGIALRIVRPAGDVHYYQVLVPRRD